MHIEEQISRESGAHGKQWHSMHDGYFADAAVARPLIETIIRHVSDSDTDIVVDLGGGTGFILQRLIAAGLSRHIASVNLDCSASQLEAMKGNRIACVNRYISDFTRRDLADENKHLFFIMRSVLHYFGRDGLTPVLRHIRRQAKAGEVFIHQTACFENETDAQCINFLYQAMHTPKWYPTVGELKERLLEAHWEVIDEHPAPPLKLSSAELGRRYGLNMPMMESISRKLLDQFGNIDHVFQYGENEFVAHLHYRIFAVRAI